MKHRLIFIFFIIASPILLLAQKTNYNGVGRWRTHFPYKDVRQIQEAGDYIFVLPEKGFFTYYQPSGEINVYSKVNGFADINISIMRFIEPLNKMVFVYATGNIDILDLKTNIITNLPDITRKNIFGEKVFYDLQFMNGKAYLSTSFGLLVIDLLKLEISESYSNEFLTPVYSSAIYKGFIYAGTSKGIARALLSGNPADGSAWKIVKDKDGHESKLLRIFDDKLYAVNDSIYQSFDGNSGDNWENVKGFVKRNVVSLENCHKKLIETHWGGFLTIMSGVSGVDSVRENRMMFGIRDKNNLIYTGGTGTGLINIKPDGNYGYFGINGPNGLTSNTIANWRDEIWVSSGGPGFVYGPTYNGAGYYHFKDNLWENRPSTPQALYEMFDFTSIAINEGNGDVWIGSHGTGIAHLQNGRFIERFDSNNSTLQRQIHKYTIVPGLSFDSKGNLWAANYDVENCVSVRMTNGKWQSYKLNTRYAADMVIDDLDQKWMSTPKASTGMVVFKEAGNGKPQQERALMKGKGSGDLPSNRVNALVCDKDNEIWIGTDEGLSVFFNPARAFDYEEDAQRIIVDQNGVVGYLLGNEAINDIAVDGANRKWFATNNGAFLVEKDGTSVLQHFNVDNSPLPSNVIKSVGINGVSGEVFFGTENGIISYGGDATEAGDKHTNVKIYPNPMRENYEGNITITGLPDYATVKITDVSGRVIYETLSNGGIATWNGRMFNGNRPQTGIYLVFSSNKEDKESLVSKMLIVH